jgi:hypothetical protein
MRENNAMISPGPPNHACVATRRNNVAILALASVLLELFCLLPFLNKAYTIDDPWFLLEARQILKTPLQPMSFEVCWMGNETCLVRAGSTNVGTIQGLMGYLLVPVILLDGREWISHLLQIFLACVAVVEMVKLSLLLGLDRRQAAVAGMLLVAIPPFLSMASTAMPDIAALALGITGLERLLVWKQERRWHQAIIASLALGIAPYARPQLAVFIPLGGIWLLNEFDIRKSAKQSRRHFYLWAPIFGAICTLISINIMTRDRGPATGTPNFLIGRGHILINLLAYFRYLSFPIPFTLVWLAAHWRKAKLLIVLPGIPILIAHFMVSPSSSLIHEWPLAAVLYGLAALVDMIYQYLKSRDRIGILLSLWILGPLPVVIYAHFPIKYMVTILPAVVLVLIRLLSALSKRRQAAAYGALIISCTAYSLVLLRADADFAEYGRRAAAELIAPYVAKGEKVWYGGEWGFYWYAQEAGARISKPGEPGPNPGDLLAVGLMEGGDATLKRFPNRELIDSRSYDSPHGRTMGYGAGLYSNSFGNALWVWNPSSTNVYQLWRVH